MRLHTLCSYELQHVKDWGHGNRFQLIGLKILQCKLHDSYAVSDKGFPARSKSKHLQNLPPIINIIEILKFHNKPKEKDKRNFSLRKSLLEDLRAIYFSRKEKKKNGHCKFSFLQLLIY